MNPGLERLRQEYDNALACVRCGLCLSVCPTYQLSLREEESPRGRIALARALMEGHLELTPDFLQDQNGCLLCEACTEICPAGVHMEQLGVPLRAVMRAGAPPPPLTRLGLRAGLALLAHPWLLRAVARLLWLYQCSGLQALARRLGVLKLLRLEHSEGLLPAIDGRFLRPHGERWRPPGGGGSAAAQAQLFAGCVMSTAYAEIDRATGRVLAAFGCETVDPPGQGCCGALHAHVGDLDGALRLARRNIDAFGDEEGFIAVNAAGCGAMLKEYAHLLRDDPRYRERAARFSARVRDVSEILDGLQPRVPLRNTSRRVTYQEPCHLAHAQRVRQPPRRLLRAIPGLELVEMKDSDVCCGSAGIYNVLQPATADALQRRKVENILATGAETVVTGNPGCMLQLADGLRRAGGGGMQVKHLVELLDEAVSPCSPS